MEINLTFKLTLPQDSDRLRVIGDVLALGDAEMKKLLAGQPTVATPAAVPVETKTRKKAEPKAPAAEAAAPAPSAVPAAPLTEKESEERLKTVGEAFVQRFSKSGDAVDEVKKVIESKFKVTRLRDLVHPQRVELIAVLESRIKEIDSKQTQAAAPAGLGL